MTSSITADSSVRDRRGNAELGLRALSDHSRVKAQCCFAVVWHPGKLPFKGCRQVQLVLHKQTLCLRLLVAVQVGEWKDIYFCRAAGSSSK